MTWGWLANCVHESCQVCAGHSALPAIEFFPGGREAKAACTTANKAHRDPRHSAQFYTDLRITLVNCIAFHAFLSTAQ